MLVVTLGGSCGGPDYGAILHSPCSLDCGVHRVGREIQFAGPDDRAHFHVDLLEPAPVPQAREHRRLRRRDQSGQIDDARKPIDEPHEQPVHWKSGHLLHPPRRGRAYGWRYRSGSIFTRGH